MGIKRDRIAAFSVQRPVNWDEKAVEKIIKRAGFVYVDVKYDGIRGVVFFDQQVHRWRVVTRENIEIVSIVDRVHELCTFHNLPVDGVYDCEVLIPGIPFEEASGILRRYEAVPAETHVALRVFDIIPSHNAPLKLRSPYVSKKPPIKSSDGFTIMEAVQRQMAKDLEEVQELFQQAQELGFEGVVVKDPDQNYTGSKVKGWFKLKPSETVDGIIKGFVDGSLGNAGKYVGFVVQLEDGSMCNATGITQDLMALITADPESYLGRYCEVTRMESTDAGKSRHPNFKCFRDLEAAKGIKS